MEHGIGCYLTSRSENDDINQIMWWYRYYLILMERCASLIGNIAILCQEEAIVTASKDQRGFIGATVLLMMNL